MRRFKSIMLPLQGKNKNNLHWLYNTATDIELPKIFSRGSLRFWFEGTSHRNSEKLLLNIEIPAPNGLELSENDAVPVENYLLGVLSPVINALSMEYANANKDAREKAQFSAQMPDEVMLRKSGISYNYDNRSIILIIHFCVPLVNALSINAKSTVRAVNDILEHIEYVVHSLDEEELSAYISCYHNQQLIREYLRRNDLCAFIANGSILPRENGTAKPMENAIPFCSPKALEIAIPLTNGEEIVGMGIMRGVTVITGGGYSGKSTLLDAIEAGVYNHIPGDGREYVIADNSALKVYAEDGRPVHSLDLSPFFRHLPQGKEVKDFSTLHASGSVSQAANIIEAVCGGAKVLLVDEDRSATNFMIRDRNMRQIVKNEPIIPFTDRVRELYSEKGVSSILVIGGSSEYLACADRVILMDEYNAKDITGELKTTSLPVNIPEATAATWTDSRRLVPKQTTQPFLYFRSVETENEKKIILDDYSADITLLTAVQYGNQMNALACVMEQLLTDKEVGSLELMEKADGILQKMFSSKGFRAMSLLSDTAWRWYEEIRPLDAYCCTNRMRGLSFSKRDVES